MNVFSVSLILLSLSIFRLMLLAGNIFQRKEYRIDRLISFFSTKEGNRFLFNPFNFYKWILLFYALLGGSQEIFAVLICVGLILDLMEGFSRFRKPKFTIRSITILLTSLIILLVIYLSFSLPMLILLLFLERITFFVLGISVCITSIPQFIYIKYQAFKARRKIESFPNLIVIGITGSFGKTTTKEFLATILSKKFHVAKTEGTNNTEIGVAKNILKNVNSDTQIFIVEMGAYKKGEIRTLCNLVHPIIGILTGINEEHIELFGSIENTMKAKYELVEGLKKEGKIFLNGSSKPLIELSKRIDKERRDIKKIWYANDSKDEKSNELHIKNIKSWVESLSFDLCSGEKCIGCKTNFGGEQFIQNILGASSVAIELGFSLNEIQKGVPDLYLPDNRLNLKHFGHVYIVDDTYNSNPDGVLSGLNYLSHFPGIRWFVFSPIIELSKEGKRVHEKVYKEASKICDCIFLTNSNFSAEFLSGGKNKIYILSKERQLDFYTFDKTKDIMIYFSGRESKNQMGLLLRKIK